MALNRYNTFKRRMSVIGFFVAAIGQAGTATADRFDTVVPMRDKGAATFYVEGTLSGLGTREMMVDTGSGYLAINEEALKAIVAQGKARYEKQLRGVLANGSEVVVPVYRIEALNIGGECWVHDVQAAVFPGRTRLILGLSALAKASPFIFEMDPPRLTLSNCVRTNKADLTPALTGAETPRLAAIVER